jgi:tripartite motif-containing protein 71
LGLSWSGDGQLDRPAGIAYDQVNKIVYVADTNNNRIQKFDINGKFSGKWGSGDG